MKCSRISGPYPVLEAKAGEQGGIAAGGLAVQIELGGPPGPGSVFELKGGGAIAAGRIGAGQGGLGFDLQVAGLFQIVGVGDEVGFVLRESGRNGQEAKEEQKECRFGI